MKPRMEINEDKKISENFYNSIKITMRVAQVIGCATFNFSKYGIRKSFLNYFYVIIQIIIFFIFILYHLFYAPDSYTNSKKTIKSVSLNKSIHMISNFFTISMLAIWFESILKVDSWCVILKNLIVIDQQLKKSGVNIDYGKYRKQSLRRLLGLLTLLSIPTVLETCLLGVRRLETIILYILPHWINGILSYIISEMVQIIGIRFKHLNILLVKLSKNVSTLSTIEEINDTPLKILCKVCTWHHNLIKLIRLSNTTFGFRLVGFFAYAFMVLVVYIFSICQVFSRSVSFTNLSAVIGLTVFNMYCVFKICNVCEKTVKHATKSGLLIHQIEVTNFDIKDEIEMFSLQIANEDKIEFNAAGFFPVNHSLLFSIIGGVTTYIIILIQLESSD